MHKFHCPVKQDLLYKLHLTCIFGYDFRGNFINYPFINTPAGIKPYPMGSRRNESALHCRTIGKHYDENPNQRPVSIYTNNTILKDDNNTVEYVINFHDLNQTKQFEIIVGEFHMNLVGPEDDFVQSSLKHHEQKKHTSPSYGGGFFYKPLGRPIFFKRGESDLKIKMSSQIYDSIEVKYIETIEELMKCKVNSVMTYSLVSLRNPFKWICNPLESPYPELGFSAFNIGEYVYFQNKQLFNRYVPKEEEEYKEGFTYDKQITELLNDIFGKKLTIIFKQMTYTLKSIT